MFQSIVGEIGISPDRFWFMSYKQIILAIRGYEKRQAREWERARLIAYQVYAGTPKKGQNKSITQYLPLASDIMNKVNKDPEKLKAQRDFFINKQREQNQKMKPD